MALLKPAPQKTKELTPEQKEKAYQIAKTVLLMRLKRKGLLKPSKMLH